MAFAHVLVQNKQMSNIHLLIIAHFVRRSRPGEVLKGVRIKGLPQIRIQVQKHPREPKVVEHFHTSNPLAVEKRCSCAYFK